MSDRSQIEERSRQIHLASPDIPQVESGATARDTVAVQRADGFAGARQAAASSGSAVSALEHRLLPLFGIALLGLVVALVFLHPDMNQREWFVVVLLAALAGAGVGAILPGTISANIGGYSKAGGALALFVLVFYVGIRFAPPVDSGVKPETRQPESLARPSQSASSNAQPNAATPATEAASGSVAPSTSGDHKLPGESASQGVENASADGCQFKDTAAPGEALPSVQRSCTLSPSSTPWHFTVPGSQCSVSAKLGGAATVTEPYDLRNDARTIKTTVEVTIVQMPNPMNHQCGNLFPKILASQYGQEAIDDLDFNDSDKPVELEGVPGSRFAINLEAGIPKSRQVVLLIALTYGGARGVVGNLGRIQIQDASMPAQ